MVNNDNHEQYFQRERAKILKQLRFASERVPFYRELLNNCLVSDIRTYGDFCRLIPIIEPNQIAERPRDFTSDNPVALVRKTSGTNGCSKQIFLTASDLRQWIKNGRLTITPYFKPGLVVAHSKRDEEHYLSALDSAVIQSGGTIITFDPKDLLKILDTIKRADIILDYIELIYNIAEQIKDLDLNLNKHLIIAYTGDALQPEDIERIKKNFARIGVKIDIYSEYATSEIGPIGCSDKIKHNRFEIIYKDNAFIEIVDPQTNQPAEEGELVVTALNRTGSVFIRYKVKDLGTIKFDDKKVYFEFGGRNDGIKLASVFFSPSRIFRIIKSQLHTPVYCSIKVKQEDFLSTVLIKITSDVEVDLQSQVALRELLIRELEFIDDIGSTVKFDLYFVKRSLNTDELKKGYTFTLETLNEHNEEVTNRNKDKTY